MVRWCRRRVETGWLAALGLGTALLSSCTALVEVPGIRVDASGAGVFVDFLGASVVFTDGGLHVDIPDFEVSVEGEVLPDR